MPPPPPAGQLQGAAATATWIFTPDPAIPNLAMPNLGLAFNIDFTPGGTAKAQLQPSLPQPRGPGTVTRGLGQNHQYLGEKLLAGRGRQTILQVRSLVSQLSSSDHEFATKWAFFLREKNNDIKRAEDNYHYHLWDRSIHIEIAFHLHDVKMIQHGILQKVLISAD